MNTRIFKTAASVVFILLVMVGSFALAHILKDSEVARSTIEQFGYRGMFVIAVVTGLNLFIPIPAATFAPVFVSAGFPLPAIIVVLTAGTLVADIVGYLIGVSGRHIARHAHPGLEARIESFARVHHSLVVPLVFLSSAFAPFPNEVVLIPLAFIGIRFRILFLPLLAGTIVYNTLIAYGLTGTFEYFF
ncbi:hypothetical protein HY416_00880 [Candidatus Kaiserbacteria bacterium]|nr:hypothetical protein [Candidatus Kaiserbacteria bacterium]